MSRDRSYQETIEYLYALQKHGVKLALSNSVALMQAMDDPQNKFRSVHVAGTNGKGSTSVFIASVLRSAGYRVGLYTSPHLVNFTERIRVNDAQISERKVVELARRVREGYQRPSAGGCPLNPTFFEVTTAIAFTYFAEEQVDIAVIEVGMGGRLDATNVIAPLVSVITNIDIEHTEFLGTTLEQISREKAGIIKHRTPVVTGVTQAEVVEVINREAAKNDATVYRLGAAFRPEQVMSAGGQVFDYHGIRATYEKIGLSMIGRYQVDNACLALAAIECVRDAGIVVEEQALRRGLAEARWEGRLELVARRPDVYLDGAHNPASARMLAKTVKEMRPAYKRLILVIGILGDKDYRGIISSIVPLADHVIVTKPSYSRAMDTAVLAPEVRLVHGAVETAATVGEAMICAQAVAAADDLILVTGSLYVVGDARAFFCAGRDADSTLSGLKG